MTKILRATSAKKATDTPGGEKIVQSAGHGKTD